MIKVFAIALLMTGLASHLVLASDVADVEITKKEQVEVATADVASEEVTVS